MLDGSPSASRPLGSPRCRGPWRAPPTRAPWTCGCGRSLRRMVAGSSIASLRPLRGPRSPPRRGASPRPRCSRSGFCCRRAIIGRSSPLRTSPSTRN
eukprot:6291809-Alexandrium_andersonii.AAC.1